jgi:hypothetical protein
MSACTRNPALGESCTPFTPTFACHMPLFARLSPTRQGRPRHNKLLDTYTDYIIKDFCTCMKVLSSLVSQPVEKGFFFNAQWCGLGDQGAATRHSLLGCPSRPRRSMQTKRGLINRPSAFHLKTWTPDMSTYLSHAAPRRQRWLTLTHFQYDTPESHDPAA